jgi:hypothetical protein
VIDRHYVTTIDRYVEDLARKSALIVHTGATRQLMNEVAVLSKTVMNLAEASLDDESSTGYPERRF